jgi:hypothetical protein
MSLQAFARISGSGKNQGCLRMTAWIWAEASLAGCNGQNAMFCACR